MTDEEIEERLTLHVRRHVETEAQKIRPPGFLCHVENEIALPLFVDQPIRDPLEIAGAIEPRQIRVDDLAVERFAGLRFELRFDDRRIDAFGAFDAHLCDHRVGCWLHSPPLLTFSRAMSRACQRV